MSSPVLARPHLRRPFLTSFLTLACAAAAFPSLGCGGRQPKSRTVVDMPPLKVVADPSGELGANYDAAALFDRGVALAEDAKYRAALRQFDRLLEEFPQDPLRPPTYYNAGWCYLQLSQWDKAETRFKQLVDHHPGTGHARDAQFQRMRVLGELGRWQEVLTLADSLEKLPDVDPDERLEALCRYANAHLQMAIQQLATHQLGAQENQQPKSPESQTAEGASPQEESLQKPALDLAQLAAHRAVSYARTRSDEDPITNNFYLGMAHFVLAESLRMRSEAIEIPEAALATQRATLETRAALLLKAQRAYFDAMGSKHPHWAAASGYQIGSMYDGFWTMVMESPIPEPQEPIESEELLELYRREYRLGLARILKPLLDHAVRYWELTEAMVARTGVENRWSQRLGEDLATLRERVALLEQTLAESDKDREDGNI